MYVGMKLDVKLSLLYICNHAYNNTSSVFLYNVLLHLFCYSWREVRPFLLLLQRNDRTKQKIEELKEVASREVFRAAHDSSEKLNLIDVVQRLGLSYHFERETEQALQHIYDQDHDQDGDLYDVALRFWLLRQHGYNVSSGNYLLFGPHVQINNSYSKFKFLREKTL